MQNYEVQLEHAAIVGFEPLRAATSNRFVGCTHLPDSGRLLFHFEPEMTQNDLLALLTAVTTHDPVIITAERSGDTVTLVATKPYNLDAATEITLVVDGVPFPTPVSLGVPITVVVADRVGFTTNDYPCQGVKI